jgi:hypothetical protein
MEFIGLGLMLIGCIGILYQDFATRYIHISFLVCLVSGIFIFRFEQIVAYPLRSVINIVYLLLMILILYLYFRLKYGKKKFVDRYIGLGDLLLFLIFSFYYSLYYYIILLICSCILGVFFWIAMRRSAKITRIPLAGCVVIMHLTSLILSFMFSFNTLEDIL